jgi:4-hydroxy 2-oxovalerate aldolase
LRDGNHAIRHKLDVQQIRTYCQAANTAGIDIVEVGHGNGLGASSFLLGMADVSDFNMLSVAREELTQSKLGIHFIPGFGRSSDLKQAFEIGVDVFRIACHCTEANITERYINEVKSFGKIAYGVLMMSHMADSNKTLEQATLMKSYGADAIILMDSAGNYLPSDAKEKVSKIVNDLQIDVGFHAHNNLGLAIANTVAAVEAGARIVDGCAKGFGAGAGNAQLEVLVSVLSRMGYKMSSNLDRILDLVEITERDIVKNAPQIERGSILSGCYGLFSGFSKHVQTQAAAYEVSEYELYRELSTRKLVAGQEDIIIEVAKKMADKANFAEDVK